jgi:ABC-type transporter Mla subunit MlaD
MSKERNELKAGIFIVITFLVAVTIVIWINGAGIGPSQTRVASFKLSDDLAGLRLGDDVRLGGYKVGVVRDIHPESLGTTDARLVVAFELPAQYTLHRDAVVGVQAGLTGASNLNIESAGSAGSPLLTDGELLVGKPDAKTALLATLGRNAPHLENTLVQIDTKTVPSRNHLIDSADGKVTTVADSARKAMDQVGDLVGDTKSDIRGTIKNLHTASDTISQKLPAVADQVKSVLTKIDASLTNAQTALLDIQKTAANARDMTGSLRSVIVDNRGKFEGMVASIKTTSDNLKEASIEIRHSPWRLLYKPTPGEAANLNLYDSAREFAQGAGSLSDAATALRDALRDPQADRAQIQKLIEQLDGSFNHFHEVENKLWVTAGQ